MDHITSIIYILFICVVVPLTLMLFVLKKNSRLFLGYMIIGICVSLIVSELNTFLLNLFDQNTYYVSTTITPVTEEIIKAIPILFYAYVFSDKTDRLLSLSFSTGIGFALFENMVIIAQNISDISLGWAIMRGFSTALMHAVCTTAVGFGISFVKKRRKLFYCGTFALLMLATLFHGIFNMLVQSDYIVIGLIIPLLVFIPIIIYRIKAR